MYAWLSMFRNVTLEMFLTCMNCGSQMSTWKLGINPHRRIRLLTRPCDFPTCRPVMKTILRGCLSLYSGSSWKWNLSEYGWPSNRSSGRKVANEGSGEALQTFTRERMMSGTFEAISRGIKTPF